MRVGSVWSTAAVAALACMALSACDQKLASQPARDHRGVDAAPANSLASTGGTAAPSAPSDAVGTPVAPEAAKPVRQIQGKPMWADNRRHSADENAQYQFERHGSELGAANLDDFLVKAHQFVNAPPQVALTLTRANGDRLLFDPKTGLFGVVRSDGAPRTVTKPSDGQAFWDKQVEENKSGGDSYRTTRRTASKAGDDRG